MAIFRWMGLLGLLGFLLLACGQKGALTLPQPENPPSPTSETTPTRAPQQQ